MYEELTEEIDNPDSNNKYNEELHESRLSKGSRKKQENLSPNKSNKHQGSPGGLQN